MPSQRDDTNSLSCDGVPPADRRNGQLILFASLAWAVVFVASSWVMKGDSAPDGATAWAIAAMCLLLGVAALASYRKFILEADELTRRIQLEGVAFGFGAGVLFSLSYQLFNIAGAPDVGLTHTGTVLVLGYVAGVLIATRRYA